MRVEVEEMIPAAAGKVGRKEPKHQMLLSEVQARS
jgi:hypothetical protein